MHGYYWNDDQPMMYFQDVRDRPRYCASHVVPLEELGSDLANPATTPNFAWVAPDDCADMEGCGIAAGDEFLKTELTAIMNSPAWRTQRSLAIITFDEDAQDFQHPAQRVPTLVLASAGVKAGYQDATRYTHYSLLRAPRALRLGRVTTFGATCIPQVPPERLREVARAAEDEGLDELWLWEDCFWGGGIATAAAVLAWTTRLRVGIGVLPVPLRNVALTAMETATLHRLFPGRLTVGVGHGVQDWMGQVGARAESPVTLLREYIEALRSLLRGDRVSTDGRYVRLDGVQLGWPPAAAPEVLAAARGPRTLRLSGEVADGAILDQVTTLEDFRTARESIDAGRAAAGRSGPHRVVQYLAARLGRPRRDRGNDPLLGRRWRRHGSPAPDLRRPGPASPHPLRRPGPPAAVTWPARGVSSRSGRRCRRSR